MSKWMQCAVCGVETTRRSPTQKYCLACSERQDLARKRRWAQTHPPTVSRKQRGRSAARRRDELAKEAGRRINAEHRRSVSWPVDGAPLLWSVRVAVPFSYAASKNHIYAMTRRGHVALRRESRAMRGRIADALRRALAGRRVAHNKVWIDILVQKPNHKGDAVNVVDLICDAVKDALPVDDRWFCIRRLDWEIAKDAAQLIVGIGQDSDQDCQVCSYCGRIKPLSEFNVSRDQPLGVGRECRECRKAGRRLAKQMRQRQAEA